MFNILLVILLIARIVIAQDPTECSPKFEYERLCECKTRYFWDGQLGEELPPKSEYTYCDNDDLSFHACYKGTCEVECEKSIRELNLIDKMGVINQEGGNNICNWVADKLAVTETGLEVVVESRPGVCVPELKIIAVDLCCNMRCSCQIHVSDSQKIDLTDRLPKKEPFYDCQRFEFGECEADCRTLAAEYLDEQRLTDLNLNYLDLMANSELADSFCEISGGQTWGFETKLVISTQPGKLGLYKEIFLGNLCCGRPCVCRFTDVDDQVILDFSDSLDFKTKASFRCNSQLDCKAKCLEYVTNFFELPLRNQLLNGANFNFFQNSQNIESSGAVELCDAINREVYRPGKYIFLEIIADTAPEKVNFGKLCCKRPCICQLVGKNYRLSEFSTFETVSHDSKLIAALGDYLPQRNVPYDCSRESYDCVRDCKIAAGNFLENEKIKDPNAAISSGDVFFDFLAASKVCKTIKRLIQSPGVDVYLRYESGFENEFQIEDLHLGRICCNEFFFPANKCKYPLMGTINSTLLFTS